MPSLRAMFSQGFSMGTKAALGASLLLLILAAFQWHWSGQLSAAEETRMRRVLDTAMERFTREFQLEILTMIKSTSQSVRSTREGFENDFGVRLTRWRENSLHPDFFDEIWLVPTRLDERPPMRFNFDANVFEPGGLENFSEALSIPNLQNATSTKDSIWEHLVKSPDPLVSVFVSTAQKRRELKRSSRNISWLLCMRIDLTYLKDTFWPELGQQVFGVDNGGEFELEIRAESDLLYRSNPTLLRSVENADANITLFSQQTFLTKIENWGTRARVRRPTPTLKRKRTPPDENSVAKVEIKPVFELFAYHRLGSVKAAVGSYRTRNLAISLGILSLLGLSLGLNWRSTRRARAVAKRELEFVAGISHELLTPLSALRAAGQNLSDGVVFRPEQVQTYGEMVQREAGRLRNMVEDVLDYAGMEAERHPPEQCVVDATAITDEALAGQSAVIQQAGLHIERRFPKETSPVFVNPRGLHRAISNLIANAAKYAASGKRIIVSVKQIHGSGAPRVSICVRDFGPGIETKDREKVFEPFYRGKASASAIPGSGLGLNLAKRIIEDFEGDLLLQNHRDGGCSFTISLPLADGENGLTATQLVEVGS